MAPAVAPPAALPLTKSAQPTPAASIDATKGLSLNLSLGCGLSLSLALETQPKYPLGSQMEVLRSDGYWSLCTLQEYDWRGVTYTVALDDARLKYFVDEDDLRLPGEYYYG